MRVDRVDAKTYYKDVEWRRKTVVGVSVKKHRETGPKEIGKGDTIDVRA